MNLRRALMITVLLLLMPVQHTFAHEGEVHSKATLGDWNTRLPLLLLIVVGVIVVDVVFIVPIYRRLRSGRFVQVGFGTRSHLLQTFRQLVAFRRVPIKLVMFTTLASFILMVGTLQLGYPLYIIALLGLLPWVPTLFFESLWKIKHYHWIAVFAVVVILQLGHVTEHIVQVGTLALADGTLACPPPVDNVTNAQRAVDAGLRNPELAATGYSAARIIKPDASGEAILGMDGMPHVGPPACGIFGQLDIEIVHLVWEMAGWGLIFVLLVQFPNSKLLWLSLAWATLHTVEHLFITYTFFLDKDATYVGARQLWGTLVEGRIVTAYPLGKEPAMLTFYDVAGKSGLLAKGGLVGSYVPALNQYLPTRPYLHLYYNLLVTTPMVVAFLQEMRHTYDQYLARALPNVAIPDLVRATPFLTTYYAEPDEVIVKEGDHAEAFFIIVRGEAQVHQENASGQNVLLNTLRAGDFFGEIGLLKGSVRQATVTAITHMELICVERETFFRLIKDSGSARILVERIMHERQRQSSRVQKAHAQA